MIDLEDGEPYLTFSEDWSYGFVERTRGTDTRVGALLWLDGRLLDTEHPIVPGIRWWSPRQARVLGLETWDEEDGTRLSQRLPGARVLWRIDISDALGLEPGREADSQCLLSRLEELRDEQRVPPRAVAQAELLLAAAEEAEAERRERQLMRPSDAPRAPLEEGAAAVLGRLVLVLSAALGDSPGEEALRSLRCLQRRLAVEQERQASVLRASLDGFEFP